MDIRYSIMAAAASAACITGCANPDRHASHPGKVRPNVVFIYADDLGRGMLSHFGQEHFQTPNIDRLFDQGTSFSYAYGCQYSAPSRASLLTGYNDCRKGYWNKPLGGPMIDVKNLSHLDRLEAPIDAVRVDPGEGDFLLPQVFKEAGYVTGQVGKLDWGFYSTRKQLREHGWDYYCGYNDHRHAHAYYPRYLVENDTLVYLPGNTLKDHGRGNGNPVLMADGKFDRTGKGTYSQDFFLDRISDFIRENKDTSFFLYHPSTLPHGPVAINEIHPAVKDNEQLNLVEKVYASMVLKLDESVGKIMDELEAQGIADNTIVIFSADNGHEIYYNTPGGCGKNRDTEGRAFDAWDNPYTTEKAKDPFNGNDGFSGKKWMNWEGSVRVPLAICWPGHIREGHVSDQVVSNYDLLPTFADLLGVDLKTEKDGVSYCPVLFDGKDHLDKDRFVFVDSDEGPAVISSDHWKLRYNKKRDEFRLHHLSEDYTEQHILNAANPDKFAELESVLHRYCGYPASDAEDFLEDDAPATAWQDAMPLGNGRLGMMPDGGVEKEHLLLNEISLWNGCDHDYAVASAPDSVKRIQQLLMQGDVPAAEAMLWTSFLPELTPVYGGYQYMADLDISYSYPDGASVKDYSRQLDMADAVAHTDFVKGGVRYHREYYVSRHSDVMFVRLTADKPSSISFNAGLSRIERGTSSVAELPGSAYLDGKVILLEGEMDSFDPEKKGMCYKTMAGVIAEGGEGSVSDSGIQVRNADEVLLVVSGATDYVAEGTVFDERNFERLSENMTEVSHKVYAVDKAEHIAAYRHYYDQADLDLPDADAERLWNNARYLFISTSAEGSLPPNLQGLWATHGRVPWNGDYHTNINLQMNYWAADECGLGELYEPLAGFMERIAESGAESAKDFYGEDAEGWVQFMKSNVWHVTSPGEKPKFGTTSTGGAWMCNQLWKHYDFSRDPEYLERIYPVLKGAAQFFVSTAVKDPSTGWLLTGPSNSSENWFYVNGDYEHTYSACMSPTTDIEIITELYRNVVEASRILGKDKRFAKRLEMDMAQFPPIQVSPSGRIQEWLEDYEEVEPTHRHLSHLYGFYPDNLISVTRTPELAQAVRTSMEIRAKGLPGEHRVNKGGTPGWNKAWRTCIWARFHEGEKAYAALQELLRACNFTFFSKGRIFQIEKNMGAGAGVNEMLVQSHDGFIEFLPAIPEAWNEGSLRGLRVRGGASVDLDWKHSRPTHFTLRAQKAGQFVIKVPEGADIAGGQALPENGLLTVSLLPGEQTDLRFVYRK